MRVCSKRGQSLLEHVVLLALLVAAILIMQFYVKRGYQGRLKQETDQLGQQYAPGRTSSISTIHSYSTSDSCTGGNCFGQGIPDGVTVTKGSSWIKSTRKESTSSFKEE